MSRPTLEVADIVHVAANSFWEQQQSHLAWPHRKVPAPLNWRAEDDLDEHTLVDLNQDLFNDTAAGIGLEQGQRRSSFKTSL